MREYACKRYKNLSEDEKTKTSIEKDITKYKKVAATSLNKVLVSSYKGENMKILEHPRFQFQQVRMQQF